MLKTRTEKYRPRTQAKALEYAASQAEQVTDLIRRRMRYLVALKSQEISRHLVGLVSYQYHEWFPHTNWNYAEMVTHNRMPVLWAELSSLIEDSYRDIYEIALPWLETAYVFGHVGFLYQIDALTPPSIKPKANLTRTVADKRLNQPWDSPRGGGASWTMRLAHQANQLYRNLQRTLEQSMLQKEGLPDVIARIKAVTGFDAPRRINESARFLEATDYSTLGLGVKFGHKIESIPTEGIIDETMWDQAKQNLRDAMGWDSREPKYDAPAYGSGYAAEQNIMTEYSQMVRSGQIDAQMPNGEVIEDFVWVIASHATLCPECEARADKTMTQIVDLFGDDTAPPLHDHCLCALIPSLPDFQPLAGDWESDGAPPDSRLMTDPETGDSSYPEVETFDEWLKRL